MLPVRPGAAHPEDGTVNYLNLPAVEIGLRGLDQIGIETIHTRVAALGTWLLDALDSLRHSDGSPLQPSACHEPGIGAAPRSRSTSCIPTAA